MTTVTMGVVEIHRSKPWHMSHSLRRVHGLGPERHVRQSRLQPEDFMRVHVITVTVVLVGMMKTRCPRMRRVPVSLVQPTLGQVRIQVEQRADVGAVATVACVVILPDVVQPFQPIDAGVV
jgi:hypothetical protein